MERTVRNTVLALTLPVFMLACNQKKVEQLSGQNAELSSTNQELSVQLEDYLQTFSEIEANLEEIKQRENLIELNTSDDLEDADKSKQRVIEDIQRINALMLENNKKMQELQSELSGTNSHFQKMVARLNGRIKEQDNQILALKGELEQMDSTNQELTANLQVLHTTLDTLSRTARAQENRIVEQTEIIEHQTAEMNKAFVAVGSLKQLKEEHVVLTEGGLFGLGKVEKLNEQAGPEAFRQINIREVQEIPVDAKKFEIVTSHPEGSYTLSKNEDEVVEKLVITDPDKFWNASRYLVVKVN